RTVAHYRLIAFPTRRSSDLEKWEAEAKKAEEIGLRVVFLRTGIVLGQGGGAWKPLRNVFKLGLGGNLGDGEQWMPWIHLEDEVADRKSTRLNSSHVKISYAV